MRARGIKDEMDRGVHWNTVCREEGSHQWKHELGTHELTGWAVSLLDRSHLGGEHHCQTLQRKNPHLRHPPGWKDQSAAEIPATPSVMVTFRHSKEGAKQGWEDMQAKAISGSPRDAVEGRRGHQQSRLKWVTGSTVPAPGHIHTQQHCPINIVVSGTRKLGTSCRSAVLQNW